MTKTKPEETFLKNYAPPPWKVPEIFLDIRIMETHTLVKARTVFVRNGEGSSPLVLDGEHMDLLSVFLDGRKLAETDYVLTAQGLTFPSLTKRELVLEVEARLDPAANTALEGLYTSGGTWCTQCEAEGFRRITFFPDRPDVLSVFTVRIEAGEKPCPVLLSNGNLMETGRAGAGRHYALWHDPFPKPCYLFALVAGDLEHIRDSFRTCSGRDVDLRIYVRKGDERQCAHAMESLKKAMRWDELAYGREYELDRFNIVAISDFNMGAMENTSLNIFNTALVLAHPDTATDQDFLRVESVIAHEYFHNWTGNRITCRDWFQLSLKEGLTVYRDQEFSADMNSRAVQRIDDVQALRSLQFPEDEGPLSHPVLPDRYIEINNFYTTTIYEKGAELIRMQALLLGPEKYRQAMDLYFERFDGMAVTIADFTKCMEDASARDLSQFRKWYTQNGTPRLDVGQIYDVAKGTYTLTLTQTNPKTENLPDKVPFHIPVAVGLIGPNGDEVMGTRILELTRESESFTFENLEARPVPSILRGFSAPVRLFTDVSDDDLRFLMIHDTDGFNRWDCFQTLTLRLIGRMLDAGERGLSFGTEPEYLRTISSLLDQCLGEGDEKGKDRALLARMLTFPDYAVIAQTRAVVDPDAIHETVKTIRKDICAASLPVLLRIFRECGKGTGENTGGENSAKRALRGAVLAILSSTGEGEVLKESETLYRAATNMTERLMALSAFMDTHDERREKILADFYERFRAFPLVVDKWFRMQACAVRPETAGDIKSLARHPDFTLRNPNRVRSLYGAFAGGNPVVFHRKDGEGYGIFEKAILDLDPINPQIASRLLTLVRDWRKYSPDRRSAMRGMLERIRGTEGLSPNSYEIVQKTLED